MRETSDQNLAAIAATESGRLVRFAVRIQGVIAGSCAAGKITLDGITIASTSDVTVRAGQSLVFNEGTNIAGPFTATTTPSACD